MFFEQFKINNNNKIISKFEDLIGSLYDFEKDFIGLKLLDFKTK